MARGSRISILGLYTYDNTIFDNMIVPSSVDKNTVINNLLIDCGELEILYPDAEFMKNAIEQWSKTEIDSWQILADMLSNSDPLNDSDYVENVHHDYEKHETGSDVTSGNSTNQVNGWNDGLVDRNVVIDNNTRTPNLKNTDVGDIKRSIKGLTGKYLKQDVMMKEIALRMNYDIDDIIIDSFKSRFCILIY